MSGMPTHRITTRAVGMKAGYARFLTLGLLLSACVGPAEPAEQEELINPSNLLQRWEDVNPTGARTVSVGSAENTITLVGWVERDRSCESLLPLGWIRHTARTFRVELAGAPAPGSAGTCQPIEQWYYFETTFAVPSGDYLVTIRFLPPGATAAVTLFLGSVSVPG